MKIDAQFFPVIDGSMTSDDGQTFFLRVRRDDNTEWMLGFPHEMLSLIVEHAAVQTAHGRGKNGAPTMTAFRATSFEIGRGPAGEAILSLTIGDAGKISLVLPAAMPGQLSEQLQKLAH